MYVLHKGLHQKIVYGFAGNWQSIRGNMWNKGGYGVDLCGSGLGNSVRWTGHHRTSSQFLQKGNLDLLHIHETSKSFFLAIGKIIITYTHSENWETSFSLPQKPQERMVPFYSRHWFKPVVRSGLQVHAGCYVACAAPMNKYLESFLSPFSEIKAQR